MDKLTTNDEVAGNLLHKRVATIKEAASKAPDLISKAAVGDLLDYITRLEAVAEASKVVLEFDDDLPKDSLHAALQHAGYA